MFEPKLLQSTNVELTHQTFFFDDSFLQSPVLQIDRRLCEGRFYFNLPFKLSFLCFAGHKDLIVVKRIRLGTQE